MSGFPFVGSWVCVFYGVLACRCQGGGWQGLGTSSVQGGSTSAKLLVPNSRPFLRAFR